MAITDHLNGNPLAGLTFGLLAIAGMLWSGAARADVIEVAGDGSLSYRTGSGSVSWFTSAPIDAPPVNAPAIPAAALTSLEGAQSPLAFRQSLERAAATTGISPALLEALVWQESRWHPQAVSPAGAIGLGQLMPGTARELGVDPRDPHANLMGAAIYLRQQLDRFDGDVERALAAYNAGPGRVAKAGGIPRIAETQGYVSAITARLANSVSANNERTMR